MRRDITAKIESITVKEYQGKTYNVTNGGTVTVGKERVEVIVTVGNIGRTHGEIITELLQDGISKGQKSLYLDSGESGTVEWQLEIPEDEKVKIIVRTGHSEWM